MAENTDTFPDPEATWQLAAQLGVAQPDAVQEVCADAEHLDAPPTSLRGLEGFSRLERLSLSGHDLDALELAPLAELPHLKSLDLSRNAFEGCPLPPLPQLEVLDLGWNRLVSTRGLEQFPALRTLHLGHNDLRELEALPSMIHLEKLSLSGNPRLRRLDVLVSLPALRELFAKQLPAEGWMAGFPPRLEGLYLSLEDLSVLAPLAESGYLRTLHLHARILDSLGDLPPLPVLETFHLTGCQPLRDVSALVSACPQLKRLTLAYCSVAETGFVAELPLLTELDLRGNPLDPARLPQRPGLRVYC